MELKAAIEWSEDKVTAGGQLNGVLIGQRVFLSTEQSVDAGGRREQVLDGVILNLRFPLHLCCNSAPAFGGFMLMGKSFLAQVDGCCHSQVIFSLILLLWSPACLGSIKIVLLETVSTKMSLERRCQFHSTDFAFSLCFFSGVRCFQHNI